MANLERVYTIPLRKEFQKAPKYKRSKKAVKALREFLMKHMKSEDISIGKHINEFVWARGIKNPPHHVKVNVIKNDKGKVMAELFGKEMPKFEEEDKKKKKKEEKIEAPKKLGEVKEEKKEEVKKEEKPVEKKEEPKKEEVKKEPVKEEPKKEEKPTEKKEEPKKEEVKKEEKKEPVEKKQETKNSK